MNQDEPRRVGPFKTNQTKAALSGWPTLPAKSMETRTNSRGISKNWPGRHPLRNSSTAASSAQQEKAAGNALRRLSFLARKGELQSGKELVNRRGWRLAGAGGQCRAHPAGL